MAAPLEIIERVSDQTDILDRPPVGFDAQEIVYRRLGFDCDRNMFAFAVLEKPTLKSTHPDFKDIDRFTQEILDSNYVQKGPDVEEDKRLDIKISRHAYIILELPSQWTFAPTMAGLTLGGAAGNRPNIDAYGELRYVTRGNRPSPVPVADCRVVYFSALNQGDEHHPYAQPINFNLFMPDGVAVIVDPDIKYPGNGES